VGGIAGSSGGRAAQAGPAVHIGLADEAGEWTRGAESRRGRWRADDGREHADRTETLVGPRVARPGEVIRGGGAGLVLAAALAACEVGQVRVAILRHRGVAVELTAVAVDVPRSVSRRGHADRPKPWNEDRRQLDALLDGVVHGDGGLQREEVGAADLHADEALID